jgi:hypothetical protein
MHYRRPDVQAEVLLDKPGIGIESPEAPGAYGKVADIRMVEVPIIFDFVDGPSEEEICGAPCDLLASARRNRMHICLRRIASVASTPQARSVAWRCGHELRSARLTPLAACSHGSWVLFHSGCRGVEPWLCPGTVHIQLDLE